ncbi:dihydropyrimidinase [Salinifilum aidingensis]
MPRTLIRSGLVITAAEEVAADVLVEDERVVALVAPDSEPAAAWAESADEVIDATDRYVIPGGVDAHTHMEMPFGGTQASDTFATGTRAAACGGTTTIVDFAIQPRGSSPRAGLEAWHAKADDECAVDYGFHMILSDVDDAALREMDALVAEGVTSFKLFMAYPGVFYSDDGQVLRTLQRAADNGALTMMHAENGIAIDVLAQQALADGRTDPKHHGQVRHPLLESEATHRAIQLSRVAGAPLYVVHVSATEAVAEISRAHRDGTPVFAETCPQYLFLTVDELDRPDFEGAKYVCSTPLRPEEHQQSLWQALRSDDLSVVSTDHCPFCFREQKELGRGDFTRIPNGIPGVENRIDLLHHAVVQQRIGRRRWVELASTSPARMFGLYPRKGTIAPGSDADLVVYDPAAEHTLSVRDQWMNVDYNAYEGTTVTGAVDAVLSRGEVVYRHGDYRGKPGRGRFLPRSLCQYLG